MVTVLLWVVAVGLPCALILWLSDLELEPKRATASAPRLRQRRQRRRRSRTRAAAPPRRPAPAKAEPAAAAAATAAPAAAGRGPSDGPPLRPAGPPMRISLWRRIWASFELVALLAVVGLMVAVSVGGVLTALALALRSAVE